MNMQRRDFLALVSLCAANGPQLLADYTPQALTVAEYDLVGSLAETLLPRDETGPGAHDARVAYYIDIVLKYSPASRVEFWKKGLRSIEQLKPSQPQDLMAGLAANELTPQSDLDHFFVEFKRVAIDAFYASELVQREHLGYTGNTAIAEFPGCPHTDFEHPGI